MKKLPTIITTRNECALGVLAFYDLVRKLEDMGIVFRLSKTGFTVTRDLGPQLDEVFAKNVTCVCSAVIMRTIERGLEYAFKREKQLAKLYPWLEMNFVDRRSAIRETIDDDAFSLKEKCVAVKDYVMLVREAEKMHSKRTSTTVTTIEPGKPPGV
ncbi:MAG TPA: hypothetical protein PKO06_12875 [Candidatus Ozemobacteraceae bacterium]|nr:hypothetical protein [Candidatus Ozemobacteraceae bacterium]